MVQIYIIFTLTFSNNTIEMRKLIASLPLLFLCSNIWAQSTAQDYFRTGLEKQKKHEYKSAIKAYDKALEMIPKYRDALYNRGNCYLDTKQYDDAINDFTAAIDLDPKFTKAYFSRAYVIFTVGNHAEALPDLDKVIALDVRTPNALSLRGQIRAELKNRHGACEDFYHAKALGDSSVLEFIEQVCSKQTVAPANKK